MDDYDIELTPNDPEFGPDECESAYALWAFKEDGEPVKFLEASLVEDPDYPSGYSFSWRSDLYRFFGHAGWRDRVAAMP